MAEFDTLELAEDVAERGSLPDSDVRFTTEKVLKACTLELREGVAPLLSASRAEHLVYPYAVAVTSGTSEYRMPPRAIGGSLRDVYFIGADGDPIELRQLSMDEVEEVGRSDATGTPYAYFTRGYVVRLVPTPNVTGTLSMPYYARPNKLVVPNECVLVRSASFFTSGGGFVEILTNVPPAEFQGANLVIDVVRATPGFETLAVGVDAEAEEIDPGVTWAFRFSASSDPGIAAGDYVCMAGEAPVPQVPVELHGLLSARAARRLVKATGDDRWQALEPDVQELEEAAKRWLSPRVAGDTQQAGGSIGFGAGGLLPIGGWNGSGF